MKKTHNATMKTSTRISNNHNNKNYSDSDIVVMKGMMTIIIGITIMMLMNRITNLIVIVMMVILKIIMLIMTGMIVIAMGMIIDWNGNDKGRNNNKFMMIIINL